MPVHLFIHIGDTHAYIVFSSCNGTKFFSLTKYISIIHVPRLPTDQTFHLHVSFVLLQGGNWKRSGYNYKRQHTTTCGEKRVVLISLWGHVPTWIYTTGMELFYTYPLGHVWGLVPVSCISLWEHWVVMYSCMWIYTTARDVLWSGLSCLGCKTQHKSW